MVTWPCVFTYGWCSTRHTDPENSSHAFAHHCSGDEVQIGRVQFNHHLHDKMCVYNTNECCWMQYPQLHNEFQFQKKNELHFHFVLDLIPKKTRSDLFLVARPTFRNCMRFKCCRGGDDSMCAVWAHDHIRWFNIRWTFDIQGTWHNEHKKTRRRNTSEERG